MNRNYVKLLASFFLFFFSFLIARAQQGTVSSGGEINGDNGYMSFTVGQMDFISIGSSNENMNQGIQQHVEVIPVKSIEGLKDGELKLSVYPNPAEEFITIDILSSDFEHLSYAIFNTEGKEIESNLLQKQNTVINLKHLSAAAYIIKILAEGIQFKEYKIVKN